MNQFIQQGHQFKFTSNTYLNHSLSLTEEVLTPWRRDEFIYENVLTLKYYSPNKLKKNLKFIKLIFRKLTKFSFHEVRLVLKTFISGKHPRC